jgi:hypothetical protein
LDALLANGITHIGGLANFCRAHSEELDVPGFLKCGAVYRVGKNDVFPVGCIELPDGGFEMPKPDKQGEVAA